TASYYGGNPGDCPEKRTVGAPPTPGSKGLGSCIDEAPGNRHASRSLHLRQPRTRTPDPDIQQCRQGSAVAAGLLALTMLFAGSDVAWGDGALISVPIVGRGDVSAAPQAQLRVGSEALVVVPVAPD